jgi:UDP-N-acetylmuramoyl-tripeptide--D-alanyl-D-alanine ligase
MVKTLVEGSNKSSRLIVVAGEMLELGKGEVTEHRKAGEDIASIGIDLLIGVRGLAKEMAAGAKAAGLEHVEFQDDSEKAGVFLANEIRAGDTVLIKGSRGVRTEKVLEKLLEKLG